MNSDFSGNVSQAQALTVERIKLYASLVYVLLFSRSPSAIIWGVIFVVVKSIQRMAAGWLDAHVVNKALKCVPSCAYFDSPSAIVVIPDVIRVFAPTNHVSPGMIFSSDGLRRRVTMTPIGVFIFFFVAFMPARLGFPGPEGRKLVDARASAFAQTFKSAVFFWVFAVAGFFISRRNFAHHSKQPIGVSCRDVYFISCIHEC